MAAAENRKAVNHLISDGINKGNMAIVDEVIAADAVDHGLPPGLPQNREGFKMFVTSFRAAFPDLTYKVEDELVDGDKVVQRVMGTATMKGDFQGMKASGKTANWQEIHIARFDAAGKLAEHWATVDQAGMLAQLGFGPQSH